MLSWLILAAGMASAQQCPPTSPEQVSSLMQQALLDFATLDEESFAVSSEQAEDSLGCLSVVFPPTSAAAYHRLAGIKAFFNGDDEAATLAFRAAQAIEPAYELPDKLAPEGGKLSRLWAGARNGPNPFIGSFAPPAGLYAYVDGTETRQRAEDLPAIIQFGIGDGSVRWTGYVLANQPPPRNLPAQGAVASAPPRAQPEAPDLADGDEGPLDFDEPEPPPEPKPKRDPKPDTSHREARADLATAPTPTPKAREHGKGGLVAATIISGVVGGGLYGGAAFSRTTFDRNPTKQTFWLTNGAYYGAIGCGALTVTFGSLAIFTGGGR
ncbi:MAG: hypothetical protein ABIO70_05200 [Pseudomonadota bacterium]